jgi:dCMP deaminase
MKRTKTRAKAQRRPSWDEYFMAIAAEVSRRSTCLRRHVGAVLVVDRRLLATGYNGAPAGVPHCQEVGCLRQQMKVPSGQRHELCRGLHAEQNAIIQAAKHGVRIDGATLYTTHHPCSMCAKMAINAGIGRIVCHEDYPDDLGKTLLAVGKVNLEVFQPPSA